MISNGWKTVLVSCVVAVIVVIGVSLSPLKLDFSAGLTPIWQRKNAPARQVSNADSKSSTSTVLTSDQNTTDDVLTITIDRGTPMRD